MQLNKIKLVNFRNYKNLDLSFEKNINIFIGDNAQGKTNLLESIYVMAISKSHRMFIDNNLIKKDELYTKIKGTLLSNNRTTDLELLINIKGKSVKINNKIIKKTSDYISKCTVIIFTPDDLEIVKGSPGIRRKFLNIEIGQLNNKYLNVLNDYNFLVKTKNDYLKKITKETLDINYLDILNEQLINKAIIIYKYRNEFMEKVSENAKKIYKDLTNENNLLIKYNPNIEFDYFDQEQISNSMKEKFKKNVQREVLQGMSLYGPHRDDFKFFIKNNEIKEYGSQGQHRLAVLCLKLGEIEMFKESKNEYPILLLDDIFSELDENKKNNIIKYIKNDIQTFITTTDLNNINKNLLKNADIFKIKEGNLIKKEKNN